MELQFRASPITGTSSCRLPPIRRIPISMRLQHGFVRASGNCALEDVAVSVTKRITECCDQTAAGVGFGIAALIGVSQKPVVGLLAQVEELFPGRGVFQIDFSCPSGGRTSPNRSMVVSCGVMDKTQALRQGGREQDQRNDHSSGECIVWAMASWSGKR